MQVVDNYKNPVKKWNIRNSIFHNRQWTSIKMFCMIWITKKTICLLYFIVRCLGLMQDLQYKLLEDGFWRLFKDWKPIEVRNSLSETTSTLNGVNSCRVAHMWLVGCPNPNKVEQSWECTFLKLFTHMMTKWAPNKVFIIGLQNYQLACMANPTLMGQIGHAC